MTNVLEFLERLGQDARLRDVAGVGVECVLRDETLSSEMRAALLSRDQRQLERLLGASANVCCLVNPARQDEEEKDPPRRASEPKSITDESAAA